MQNTELKRIGSIKSNNDLYIIEIDKKYHSALNSLEGFSHLQVLWWGHLCDIPEYRSILSISKPYTKGPENVGIFATRSPMRPNPILLSTIEVSNIDLQYGCIYTPFMDAEIGSIVLDIKPYHMSDRVKNCAVPDWCKHWPQWHEDSALFNWNNEFNF